MKVTKEQAQRYKAQILNIVPSYITHVDGITEHVYHLHGVVIQVVAEQGVEVSDGVFHFYTPAEWVEWVKPSKSRNNPTGVDLIAKERAKHPALGYDAEHDGYEKNQELAVTAALYALNGTYLQDLVDDEAAQAMWPWTDYPNKCNKLDRVQQLVVAGSWIAAEIDRLLQVKEQEQNNETNN